MAMRKSPGGITSNAVLILPLDPPSSDTPTIAVKSEISLLANN